MDQIEIPTLLAVVFGLCLLLQTAAVRRARSLSSRRARRRAAHALRGEARAEPLLRRLGYTVVERQPRVPFRVDVDGQPVEVQLRADLLVRRGGRHFVAEVKTGARATRVEHGATRRQLLEYGLAFDADGVLLVDADSGDVRHIVFPMARSLTPSRWAGAWWLVAGALLGAVATHLLL